MNMKKTITSFLLACTSLLCFGQITISNNYFPNGGDSLVTATATAQTAAAVFITKASSTAQSWNYNFLRARTPTTRTVDRYRTLNATTDTAILREFPTATMVIADTSGQISVYRRTTTRFDLLGYFNANLGFLPLALRPKFNPPSLERRAPLIFNSTNTNSTAYNVPFSTNFIPDTFFAALPVRPDSMRIRFVTSRQDKVDAFGKIKIPGSGEIDCLRERRFEISETRIDVKTNLLPIWLDITTLIPTGNLRVKDTTLVFQFWSDLYKEPLLSINATNDSTPISAIYKWLPINTPTAETASNVSAIVYPTPAKEAVNVYLDGLSPNDYHLQIVDGMGRIVFNKKIENKMDNTLLHIDTQGWATGIYFLNLFSETDKMTVLRKTFVIEQ
jgi:hypothetical protein